MALGLLVVGATAAAVVALVVLATGFGEASSNDKTIGIRYSRFLPEAMEVGVGEPVTFTLVNDDPIGHEWMIGDAAFHERHRTGTEPFHDTVPTEVTIPALETRVTTVTFAEPGEYLYICHLPGHEAYGMTGVLKVVE
jgi:plastocyanin